MVVWLVEDQLAALHIEVFVAEKFKVLHCVLVVVVRYASRPPVSVLHRLVKTVNEVDDLLLRGLSELADMVEQSLAELKVPLHVLLRLDDVVSELLELKVPPFLLSLRLFILQSGALVVELLDFLV